MGYSCTFLGQSRALNISTNIDLCHSHTNLFQSFPFPFVLREKSLVFSMLSSRLAIGGQFPAKDCAFPSAVDKA